MTQRKLSSLPRALLWIVAAVALLTVLLGLGISVWVGNFLRSDSFRQLVESQTGRALAAEVDFAAFQWTGSNVFSESLTASGLPGSAVVELEASQARASVDWRAVFQGAWRVEALDVLDLKVSLRPPDPSLKPDQPGDSSPMALPGFLPRKFELGPVRARQAAINYRDTSGSFQASLSDTTLRIETKGASSEFSGTGGVFRLSGQPKIDINSYQARSSKDTFFLTEARGRLGESGKISASGQFGGHSEMRIQWSEVDAGQVIPEEWKDSLSGRLSGEADLIWQTNQKPEARGKFLLSEGLLRNIALLDQIANFTASPQFRRMPLQEVSGRFHWNGTSWDIQNFVLESKGLLRTEGSFRVSADGELEGTFRVGVTPQVLQWIPGSKERVFTLNQGGYVWTDVQLGGTLDNPKENLSSRLAAAAAGELIDRGSRAISDPAGAAREGAQDLLDVLTPLVR